MIVEDDASLAEWIADYLTSQNYDVSVSNRGDEAVHLIQSDNPDLVLLDINLPVKDGFDICREVRKFYHHPILMMTARNEEMDEVLGLELGADDYILKPIRPRALLARIKALLRRIEIDGNDNQSSDNLTFGNFSINYSSRTTLFKGHSIPVSSNEFEVLWILANHAGTIVSRKSLIKELRGIEYDGFDRSTDILISRLRKKLDDNPSEPYRIKTVWGKGYLFSPDAWEKS